MLDTAKFIIDHINLQMTDIGTAAKGQKFGNADLTSSRRGAAEARAKSKADKFGLTRMYRVDYRKSL
jgi:hypothetical protein